MKKTPLILQLSLLLVGISAHPFFADGQELEANSGYRSQIDEDLTIKRSALLPVSDNVGGIYARPLETELSRLIKEDHRFNNVDYSGPAQLPILDELEESPPQMQAIGKGMNVDALIAAKVTKGPKGVSITLDLFLTNDGKLLLQETLRDHPRFEITEIKDKIQVLYRKMIARLPYDGMILSRSENKITLSLGHRNGVQAGQVVSAILILQVQRHPKFNFLISSEKEILGKIRLTKVDDTLSFGTILTEKDRGSIRKMTKVAGLEVVSYPDDSLVAAVPAKNPIVSGEDKEWLPTQPPTFGRLGFQVGFGSYAHKTSINNVGAFEGRTSIYPQIQLQGELWLTPRLLARAHMRQGIVTFKNPRESSSPSDLTTALSSYDLSIGYNVLMRDDFWGPKVTLLGGFYQYKSAIDNSQPTAFTSMSFQGLTIGVEGVLPIDEKRIWAMGAGVRMMFQPTLNESPESSGGNSRNTVNNFYLFGRKKLSESIEATGTLSLESYSSTLSGDGTRPESVSTDSQTSTVLAGGVNYLF